MIDGHTDGQTDTQTDTQTDRLTEAEREKEKERERERESEREKDDTLDGAHVCASRISVRHVSNLSHITQNQPYMHSKESYKLSEKRR